MGEDSENPPSQIGSQIQQPEWLRREKERLTSKVAQAALDQSRQGPPKPGSIAPSVEGTKRSPFEAAAREGNLPSKVTGGYEAETVEQARKKQKKAEIKERIKEFIRSTLEMETREPK